ncbi:MAG: aminotransferase class V-fold PLP-dependent enzyme [Acidimicrobiia bacterium]|nr:aminotransferase class V-fold PLP-dependent enzyme [Acidimicrobiia bacterium]
MSLDHGRRLTAIPGPSVMPDRVLAAMHRAMPNIYEGELIQISLRVLDELPALARTSSEAFITISNGHGAWEMALTNTLSRGQRVLVAESGRFARAWGDMAAMLGLDVVTVEGSDRAAVDPAAVEAALRVDRDRTIAAVLVVQVDTATSVRNDIGAIRAALDAADHPALLMVDCIASLGCERYEMDLWGVDVTVASSQKGLMVPPGLGFVWASSKARVAHESADLRTGYWDWTARSKPDTHYQRYCGTPPVSHLFGLAEALDMLWEEGLDAVWDRHEALASAVRAAVDAWAAPGGLEFNITAPAERSNAVTTLRTPGVEADRLRALCEQQAGLTLGVGLEGLGFRIGHMGHLNPPMVLGVLGTLEAALRAMDVPTAGSGVAAAAASLAPHLDPRSVDLTGLRA